MSTLSRVAAKRWVNVINGKGVFSKGLKVNIEKQNSFFNNMAKETCESTTRKTDGEF